MENKKIANNNENILLSFLIFCKQKYKNNNKIDALYNTTITKILKNISPNYFVNANNKKIFTAIKNLFLNNKIVNPFNLVSYLVESKNYEEKAAYDLVYHYFDYDFVSEKKFLSELVDQIIKTGHLLDIRKVLKSVDVDLQNKNLLNIYSKIETLFKKWNYGEKIDVVFSKDIILDIIEEIKENNLSKKPIIGVPSGYNVLDTMVKGFQKGRFIILAARPSFGKTSLALNFAKNACEYNSKYKRKIVLFITLEMSKEELIKRLLSSYSGLSTDKINSGKLTNEEITSLQYASIKIEKLNLLINAKTFLNIDDLILIIKNLEKEYKIELVIIDYLQLISVSNYKGLSREQQVATISRKLKLLANDHKIPIIALSQLSRKTEQRESKRPLMSDLRESGSLEQDADLVLFLYRQLYYESNSIKNDIINSKNVEKIEVIIAKNRHGRIGSFYLNFIKSLSTFENE